MEFVSDFDNNGIMHYIATQGGNTPWQNPALVGRITILASSLDKGSPHDLLELKPQDMWSRDVPSSWITIDLVRSVMLNLANIINIGPQACSNSDSIYSPPRNEFSCRCPKNMGSPGINTAPH